jgi:hypothetical protein
VSIPCPFCKRDIPNPVDGMFEFHIGCHIRDMVSERFPELAELRDRIRDEFEYPVEVVIQIDALKVLELKRMADSVEDTPVLTGAEET